jgi:hypothetical protein
MIKSRSMSLERTCIMHGRGKKWTENFKGKDHLEDLSV